MDALIIFSTNQIFAEIKSPIYAVKTGTVLQKRKKLSQFEISRKTNFYDYEFYATVYIPDGCYS